MQDRQHAGTRGNARRPDALGSELTETICGVHAGLAVFAQRPSDVRAIAFEGSVRSSLAELLRWASTHGVPASEESSEQLARRAETHQHEGLVLAVRPRTWLPPKELASFLTQRRGLAVALDRVRNPQNIGAILRSAAFFGADAVLLGAPAPHPGLAPFAVRVAEGGAEHLVFSRTTDLADTLGRLRAAGVYVIGADTHGAASKPDLRVAGASLLVLGHEREGLGGRIRAQCDVCLGISGSGAVESLNVAVAAGVLLSEVRRARQAAGVERGHASSGSSALEAVEHRR
ncbi:MAG TPA: RNA methyltransferase [Polyangiaceae bacterium]|nr:RNA methyltransferase [Polyangiaceae bacterium]